MNAGAEATAANLAARDRSWFASLLLRRVSEGRGRLTELREWLAHLPRRGRRAFLRRWGLVLPAALFLTVLSGGAVEAATITVGTEGCTLSAAITNANKADQSGSTSCAAGSGEDTIRFAIASGTYELTVPLPEIQTDITIAGNGNTTIRGMSESVRRILSITVPGSLALSAVTITGGQGEEFRGDGGGGLAVAAGTTANIASSLISGNSGDYGAGIVSRGALTLTDSSIMANSGNYGGGIAILGGSASISGSTISGNSADTGGGMYVDGPTHVHVVNSVINGNQARDEGGGVDLEDPETVSIKSSVLSGNSAPDGGGLYNYGAHLTIEDSVISENRARDSGGGVSTYSGVSVITGSIIAGNLAGGSGGGLSNGGSLSVLRTALYGNTAGTFGGGIFSDHSLSVVNSTISGNRADFGGGIGHDGEDILWISNATIADNEADGAGGGIFLDTTLEYRQVGIAGTLLTGHEVGGDCAGSIELLVSQGYNIESAKSCDFTETGDLQNIARAHLKLGPLDLNIPGFARTHALLPGSIAVDQVPLGTLGCGGIVDTDQRGVQRPNPPDGRCDIGAYELDALAPLPQTATPGTPTATRSPSRTPAPTQTPSITRTPPPTSTRRPSATPTPRPTATPDDAEQRRIFLPYESSG